VTEAAPDLCTDRRRSGRSKQEISSEWRQIHARLLVRRAVLASYRLSQGRSVAPLQLHDYTSEWIA
jgi:hypothetical protein